MLANVQSISKIKAHMYTHTSTQRQICNEVPKIRNVPPALGRYALGALSLINKNKEINKAHEFNLGPSIDMKLKHDKARICVEIYSG